MLRLTQSLSWFLSLARLVQPAASLAVAQPIELTLEPRNVLSKRSVAGPAISPNFPDPSIYQSSNGTWYAFATRTIGSTINVPVAMSADFNSWTVLTHSDGSRMDAVPTVPTWVASGTGAANFWAPDVNQLDDGSYVLYFSASTAADTTKHCVGAATSKSVTGPYVPTSMTTPLICNLTAGGAIDPSGFRDNNGLRYLAYKIDGNSVGHGGICGNSVAPIVSTGLMLQQVSSDGITFVGAPFKMLDNQGVSDDGVVEAPSMTRGTAPVGSFYFLFFSSGCFLTPNYTVSYAVSRTLTGPYMRAAQPLLKAGQYGLTSPGGADIAADKTHLVFHDGARPNRKMYTAMVTIANGRIII